MQQYELCIKEIETEIDLIDELLSSHNILLEKTKSASLSRIEISATATVLHSFYNGIENIFLRIANRLDNKIPSSEFWHKELLEQNVFTGWVDRTVRLWKIYPLEEFLANGTCEPLSPEQLKEYGVD